MSPIIKVPVKYIFWNYKELNYTANVRSKKMVVWHHL